MRMLQSKMLRIGIDASRAFIDQPTGTERYSYEVIMRLLGLPEAKEHEWILYVKSQIPNLEIQTRSNIQLVQIPMKYLWTQVGLAARTWVDGLDALWVPAHTLPILRRGFGGLGSPLKTVVTIHGIEYEWLPAYENWLQRWYLPLSTKYAVKSADKIIAVSEFTKRQLIERLKADSRKVEVVYEGVNTSPSNPSPKLGEGRKGEVLKRWGLKPKQYLLFVGTVQPRKNLGRLIEAFASLKSQASGLKLVICGKLGWSYDEILTAPEKYNVRERVVFTGFVPEPERVELLKSALVYVQPSITEGFGLPVLEAMAAGVPVVSSRGGALEEVVGKAGLLFDPYDVEEMRHKLSLIIDSYLLRKELIEKDRRRVGGFTWEKAANETYRILTD